MASSSGAQCFLEMTGDLHQNKVPLLLSRFSWGGKRFGSRKGRFGFGCVGLLVQETTVLVPIESGSVPVSL